MTSIQKPENLSKGTVGVVVVVRIGEEIVQIRKEDTKMKLRSKIEWEVVTKDVWVHDGVEERD